MSEDKPVPDQQTLLRRASDLAVAQIALIFCVAGIVALAISATIEGDEGSSTLAVTVREIGALLFVTSTVSLFWELRGRRALTQEILDAAHLSTEVQDAGICRVANSYRELDWDAHLAGATDVDLFFAYAAGWRSAHATELQRLVARRCVHLRVVLPDPDNAELVAHLARRFTYTQEKVRRLIHDARADVEHLRRLAHESATVELRWTGQDPIYTYYRFDRVCAFVLYSQAPGRFEVPSIELAEGGTLSAFFRQQFDHLWVAADPSDRTSIMNA